MDIHIFHPDELPVALGAVRGIDPDPTPAQDRFLGVVARLHGAEIDPCTLPEPTPAEAAELIADPHRRKRTLQLAMVMAMIDGEVGREPAARVAELAGALGVDERGVRTLRKMAAHQDGLARLDLMRRVGGSLMGAAWRDERWTGVRKLISGMRGTNADGPEIGRRFNKLGMLPAGTFGRTLWEHMVSRDFSFPGQPGGIPLIAVFHDLGHVLSGYDTDPDGEIQQAAFQAGFVRNDGFMFLFFAIAQFHMGMKITPVADGYVGHFDADRVMTALQRGASCKVDLSDRWDYWPYMPRPLDEVRAELGIPALIAAPGSSLRPAD